MCLARQVDFEVPDPGIGWKVFYFDSCEPHIKSIASLCIYPVFYTWLNAKDVFETFEEDAWRVELTDGYRVPYLNGFHIFLEKKDACEWWNNDTAVVLPVCYQNVVATGYQNGKKVVVAREMMILVERP